MSCILLFIASTSESVLSRRKGLKVKGRRSTFLTSVHFRLTQKQHRITYLCFRFLQFLSYPELGPAHLVFIWRTALVFLFIQILTTLQSPSPRSVALCVLLLFIHSKFYRASLYLFYFFAYNTMEDRA